MLKPLKDIVALFIGLIEILLGFRFILKLLGANPRAEVVSIIYQLSAPLLRPFAFAFPTSAIKGGFVLEFTTLFALFAYAFLGYIIEQLLELLSPKRVAKTTTVIEEGPSTTTTE